MRFAVVLDAKEGALPRMLLAYRLGLGSKIGSGKQPFAWISIYDLVRAIDFVMLNSISGKINMVTPGVVTQKDFAKILAEVLKRPCFLKMPAWVCKLIFGQMGDELLLHGQNVYPKRLLEQGFSFSHDSLKKALLELGVK